MVDNYAVMATCVVEVRGAANAMRTRIIETFCKDVKGVSMRKLCEKIGVLDLTLDFSRIFVKR